MTGIRVVIVDDQALMRTAFRTILESAGLQEVTVTPHTGWLGHGRKASRAQENNGAGNGER